MSKMWYEFWFANVEGISASRKIIIREQIGSAETLYNIEEKGCDLKKYSVLFKGEEEKIRASKTRKNWEKEYERLNKQNIRMILYDDNSYPRRMKELAGMPYALYCKGKMPDEKKMSVAMVGARRCSPYGEKMTLEFAERLAEEDIQIISGMARGIDGAAHRGALNVGGFTFAVLGCGVDICYPKEHKGLYKDLEAKGGILSEYMPGTPPLPGFFPARNRIISAMADVVLVMEAREKSGSLITADMALEQGRDVYALPGSVESELSRGCNSLIRQGAGILLGTEDLLKELGIQAKNKKQTGSRKGNKNKIMLETVEKLVYSKLDLYPRGREELLRETDLTSRELTEVLVSLQLKGYVIERSKNYYIRRE